MGLLSAQSFAWLRRPCEIHLPTERFKCVFKKCQASAALGQAMIFLVQRRTCGLLWLRACISTCQSTRAANNRDGITAYFSFSPVLSSRSCPALLPVSRVYSICYHISSHSIRLEVELSFMRRGRTLISFQLTFFPCLGLRYFIPLHFLLFFTMYYSKTILLKMGDLNLT